MTKVRLAKQSARIALYYRGTYGLYLVQYTSHPYIYGCARDATVHYLTIIGVSWSDHPRWLNCHLQDAGLRCLRCSHIEAVFNAAQTYLCCAHFVSVRSL